MDQTPDIPCSGTISREVSPDAAATTTTETTSTPSDAALRGARWANLTFAPATEPAKAFAARVVSLAIQNHSGSRSVGRATRATWEYQIGAILGDLMRAARKGGAVAAHRGKHGPIWDHPLIGHHAYWERVDLLRAMGLIGFRNGVQTPERFGGDHGGLPAKLWATSKLIQLGEEFGVPPENAKLDWRTSERAETEIPRLSPDQLVRVKTFDDPPAPSEPRPDQRDEAEAIRADLTALNEAVAGSGVRGCRAPVFRRSFRVDLRLGGRAHAVGTGNFQNMSVERQSGCEFCVNQDET